MFFVYGLAFSTLLSNKRSFVVAATHLELITYLQPRSQLEFLPHHNSTTSCHGELKSKLVRCTLRPSHHSLSKTANKTLKTSPASKKP